MSRSRKKRAVHHIAGSGESNRFDKTTTHKRFRVEQRRAMYVGDEPPKSMREIFDLDYLGHHDGKADWTFDEDQEHAEFIKRKK